MIVLFSFLKYYFKYYSYNLTMYKQSGKFANRVLQRVDYQEQMYSPK